MNHRNFCKAVLLFLLSFALVACNDKGDEADQLQALDDILADCAISEFNSKDLVEGNLIGEWKLIGIRPGWFNEFRNENITLTIDEDMIVLNHHETGEVLETTWEVQAFDVDFGLIFRLVTDQSGFNNRLGMEVFCENHMHGTGGIADGETYIYEKVR